MLQKSIFFFILFLSIVWHANGQKLEIKTYFDGEKKFVKEIYQIDKGNPEVLNGHYQSFFPSGKKEIVGFYKDNFASGIWTYFYYNGKIRMKGEMVDNEPEGSWEYFYENGTLHMKGAIKNGERNGFWTFYFENGNTKSEGTFLNGNKTGLWKYYYEDETLKAQANYFDNKAHYKEYYPSGNIKAIGYKKDEKSDSLWTYFYENAHKLSEGPFEEGRRSGKWVFYHQNGVKSSEGNFSEGKKNGYWKYFDEHGDLSSEGIVLDDKKEGYWKLYFSGGGLKGDGHFDKGTGEFKEYYESGMLKKSGYIENDVKEGKWHYYYETGELEGEIFFVNGKGNFTGYYETGEIKMKGAIDNDKRIGTWVLYKPDGEIAGYYSTVYNKDDFKFDDLFEANLEVNTDTTSYEKPAYKFKNNKSRYFQSRLNEFRGVILSANPIALVFGELPVAVEYYMQERMGYEVQFSLLRSPFFERDAAVKTDNLYERGYAVAVKQKFYQEDKNYGMLYLGHEFRFTQMNYKVNALLSTNPQGSNIQTIKEACQKYEYSIFLGNRIIRDAGESGITLDAFIGIGVGYRQYNGQDYSGGNYWMKEKFSDVPKTKLTVPLRVGLNIGFVF